MDDLRRCPTYDYHTRNEVSRTHARRQKKKQQPGSWQPTVPSWEKQFCFSVGSIPWGKLLEAKKLMSFYENVVQWNDSAGEEAFNNAKNRFWAKINDLPCDISLPDPDIYIDEIDWNSIIDPELLLDLDREPVLPDESETEEANAVFVGDALFFLNQPIVPTGWGDVEEDRDQTAKNSSSGIGLGYCDQNSPFFLNQPIVATGWGDVEEDQDQTAKNSSSGGIGLGYSDQNADNGEVNNGTLDGKKWGYSDKQWENTTKDSENMNTRKESGFGGNWDWNGMNRESSGRFMSRYKTSRFHGDYYQRDGGYGNGKGSKGADFAYKKPWNQHEWNSFRSCHRPVLKL